MIIYKITILNKIGFNKLKSLISIKFTFVVYIFKNQIFKLNLHIIYFIN